MEVEEECKEEEQNKRLTRSQSRKNKLTEQQQKRKTNIKAPKGKNKKIKKDIKASQQQLEIEEDEQEIQDQENFELEQQQQQQQNNKKKKINKPKKRKRQQKKKQNKKKKSEEIEVEEQEEQVDQNNNQENKNQPDQKPKFSEEILKYKESRVEKAINEKNFIMKAERHNQNSWKFIIQGFAGNNYHVLISRERTYCNCMDCRYRQRNCKHIYFIVAKIAHLDDLLEEMGIKLGWTDEQYDQLDFGLISRLTQRIDGYKIGNKQKNQKFDQDANDKDCAICYDDMKIDDQLSQCLRGCRKYFHQQCITAWLKTKDTCPLCRDKWFNNSESKSEYVQGNEFGGKAMGKLQQQNININDDIIEENDPENLNNEEEDELYIA